MNESHERVIFPIKPSYTPDEIYPPVTIILTVVADTQRDHIQYFDTATLEYVQLLSPADIHVAVADTAWMSLPDVLWGRVPHTLPMMVYRLHSLISFWNERVPGIVSYDIETNVVAYYPFDNPNYIKVDSYLEMLSKAEKMLEESTL